jgi:drug/metabolite transporter (DMT)-like permease
MALAMVGTVLAGREAPEPDSQARPTAQNAVLLALLAAVGFGSFFAGMDRAEESGDVAWVLLAARTPEVLLLLAACAVRRPGLPSAAALGAIAAIGFFDLLATLLFVLATGRGLLSVVGVLAALYPAVTVLLARMVLRERLTRAQDVGVLLALAGVVALAVGA